MSSSEKRKEQLRAIFLKAGGDLIGEIHARIDSGKIIDPYVIAFFKSNVHIYYSRLGETDNGVKEESK